MPVNSFEHYPMSWKPKKEDLKRPIYLSLARQLEEDIAHGYLQPGTRLPPQRELADFLDINFTTVTRAYRECELKGLIHAVTGSGTFVSHHSKVATISHAQPDQERKPAIELGFVASFEQTNAMLRESIRAVTKEDFLDQLLDYSDPSGIPHQRGALSDWLRNFNVDIPPEELMIVSGTQNGLAIALSALFGPGDRIAVDHFTYPNFIELAKLYRLQLVPVEGDGSGMLPDALETQCRLNPIQGIFLMPSCGNPTTVRIPEYRKKELGEVIRKNNLTLIEDEVHAFIETALYPDPPAPLYTFAGENSVFICGTSKPICSGLRVACMRAGASVRQRVQNALFNINVKTPSLNAEIITQTIRTGRDIEIMQKKLSLAEQANKIFTELFPWYRMRQPYSYYQWLPIRSQESGPEFEARCAEQGIRVFHSDRFLVGTPGEESFLRISMASTADMSELEEGLKILSGLLVT